MINHFFEKKSFVVGIEDHILIHSLVEKIQASRIYEPFDIRYI